MTTQKKKRQLQPQGQPRKQLECRAGPSIDERGKAFATLITSPELAAHRVIALMQPKDVADEIDVPGMIASLSSQSASIQRGDLAQTEAMLINQATALQSIFARLTEKAMQQSHLPNLESFMKLALRAQSQCRATIETLSVIKNPPVIYARQANLTTGPQQINNSLSTDQAPQGIEFSQNQLSEVPHELCSNTGTSSITSPANPPMETLGAVNRTQDA